MSVAKMHKRKSAWYLLNAMTLEEAIELMTQKDGDYFVGGMEIGPPAMWFCGKNAEGKRAAFGVEHGKELDANDVEKYVQLVAGFDESGANLVRNAGQKDRVGLYDVTLTDNKDLSVLYGVAPEQVKKQIEKITIDSTIDALDFLNDKAAISRIRDSKTGNIIPVKANYVAVLFPHVTTRPVLMPDGEYTADPNLHRHVGIINTCQHAHGTGAVETREALKWQGAFVAVESVFTCNRLLEMGVPVVRGQDNPLNYTIEGVPPELCVEFSKRSEMMKAAVAEKLKEFGIVDADLTGKKYKALRDTEILRSREDKDKDTRSMAQIQAAWIEVGERFGFAEKEVLAMLELNLKSNVLQPKPSREALLELVNGVPDRLTEKDAVFTEAKIYIEVCKSLIGQKFDIEDIHACVEHLKAGMWTQYSAEDETQYFSTHRFVALEKEMVELAAARAPEYKLDLDHTEEVLHTYQRKLFDETGKKMSAEQEAAYRRIVGDEFRTSLFQAPAGAGKTWTLAPIIDAYKGAGYKIEAIALQWTAAKILKEEAALERYRAVEGWLREIETGTRTLDAKTVIVIDEIGMVGSEHMWRTQKLATAAGCKIIGVGELEQVKAVAAGNALKHMDLALTAAREDGQGSARLEAVIRQNDESHRVATKNFRIGKNREAFSVYNAQGKVRLFRSDGEEGKSADELANAAIVADWWKYRQESPSKSTLIISGTNKSALELNLRARAELLRAGLIEVGNSIKLETRDCTKEQPAIEFFVGDQICLRANAKRMKIDAENEVSDAYNRTRAVIEKIVGNKLHCRILDKDGVAKEKLVIDTDDKKWREDGKKNGRLELQLGYATSIYASQGMTRDRVFVKDHSGMTRELLYVAMSRHKQDVTYYADLDARHEQMMAKGAVEDWRRVGSISDEEFLDFIADSTSREGKKQSTLDFAPEYLSPAQRAQQEAAEAIAGAQLRATEIVRQREVRSDVEIVAEAGKQNPETWLRKASIPYVKETDGSFTVNGADRIRQDAKGAWWCECAAVGGTLSPAHYYAAHHNLVRDQSADQIAIDGARAMLGLNAVPAISLKEQPLARLAPAQQSQAAQSLLALGLSQTTIDAARRAGFLDFTNTGGGPAPVFVGRDATGKAVSHWSSQSADKNILRRRFPPILRGPGDQIHIVRDGVEALAVWQLADEKKAPRPTVVVLHEQTVWQKNESLVRMFASAGSVIDERGDLGTKFAEAIGKSPILGNGEIYGLLGTEEDVQLPDLTDGFARGQKMTRDGLVESTSEIARPIHIRNDKSI